MTYKSEKHISWKKNYGHLSDILKSSFEEQAFWAQLLILNYQDMLLLFTNILILNMHKALKVYVIPHYKK